LHYFVWFVKTTKASFLQEIQLRPSLEVRNWSSDFFLKLYKGVGFRFADIRSLFFTEFLGLKEGAVGVDVPEIHHLTKNFRTHSAICHLARSVVDLMTYFFPDNVDKLKRESGIMFFKITE
jgi:hypothetical protein